MTDKLPLTVQVGIDGKPTNVPTRKWFAGLSSGIATAVALAPVIFPEIMNVLQAWAPEFAAEYGQRIAITVASIVSVLGGQGVAWVVKNRVTPAQAEVAKELLTQAAAAKVTDLASVALKKGD